MDRAAAPRIVMPRSALRQRLNQQEDAERNVMMIRAARQRAWHHHAALINAVKISAACRRVTQRGNSERIKAMRNAARRFLAG